MEVLLAYFDPSAGSLLLQALACGFGGIVVAGRYLWTHLTGNRTLPEVIHQSQELIQRSQEIRIPVPNSR